MGFLLPARDCWKAIPGFVGIYEVSNLGQVRRITSRQGTTAGRVLKGKKNRDGYLRVSLWNSPNPPVDKLVHVLVCEAFHGPRPAGMECRHLDGDPSNARADNLCWGTPVENAADRDRHGRQPRGETHHSARLTDAEVTAVRTAVGSQREIARRFGLSQQHVSDLKRGARRADAR